MTRRRFLAISAIGAVPYAVVHVAIGYGASEVFARLSPAFAREAVAFAAVLLLLALLWYVLLRIIGLVPLISTLLAAALHGIAAEPSVARRMAAHPRLVSVLSARLSRTRFRGLPLTLTVATLILLAALWVGSTVDYLSGDPIIRADRNIASLLYSLQTAFGLGLASRITAIGGWQAALCVIAASGLALWFRGHRALALGLAVATLGQAATVSLLNPPRK